MAAPTITTGILTGGTNSHATSAEEVNGVATDFVTEGIVGTLTNTSGVAPMTGGFAVNASGTPDTNINISTGVAYVTATPTSQNSQNLRIKCTVTGTLTISANASGSTKYDWIYISVSATNAANPSSAADNVATIVASRSTSASTDDGTPPAYGYPIAVVTVANGFSTITNSNIRDIRTNTNVTLGSSGSSTGWLDLGYTPNTVTDNGNGSYSWVFNSVDLTSTVSEGTRLKVTRVSAAPTQCTSLNGTTQYYSKTSPAGMTFTDDFVVSAWVKLTSYNGTQQTMVSRYNGTSGWEFYISASGQVGLIGYNAGSGNNSFVQSYQSIPLNKWVHVAAQLDMSTFTATTTTSYVMIGGFDVPATVTRSGTNPTSLINNVGNLEIGGRNGGTLPFTGKISQVAIYSAKVTQATVRASRNQTLVGTETSLISAYSFNNTINDLNVSNANNLTANGAAVATNADSPFSLSSAGVPTGTTDYAIVTSKTFSTNTTLTVQVPEGNTITTSSSGISAVAYSTHKVPYGFIAQRGKWQITEIRRTSITKAAATASTWYNTGTATGDFGLITIPVGEWILSHTTEVYVSSNTSGPISGLVTLSTTNSTETNPEFTAAVAGRGTISGSFAMETSVSKSASLSLSAQTIFYRNFETLDANNGSIQLQASTANSNITAECAYV